MSEPVWVPLRAVTVIHDRQISRHGGRAGLRDLALLEMACARAMNLFACGQPSLAEIAAAYAFGIVKAHAFVDGNKRTAFVTAAAFLRLNGYAFRPEPAEGVKMMEALASGEVAEAHFAQWLARGMTPLSPQVLASPGKSPNRSGGFRLSRSPAAPGRRGRASRR